MPLRSMDWFEKLGLRRNSPGVLGPDAGIDEQGYLEDLSVVKPVQEIFLMSFMAT